MAISNVFAGRAPVNDPSLRVRLENAYAEVVRSHPRLRDHIQCGRQADGTFHWRYPLDPAKSARVRYSGLRVFNAVTRQTIPLDMDEQRASAVGWFIGCLDGTRTAEELQKEIRRFTVFGPDLVEFLTALLERLGTQNCLAVSRHSSVREHWLGATRDRDVVHLGHAALLYRQNADFFLFDP